MSISAEKKVYVAEQVAMKTRYWMRSFLIVFSFLYAVAVVIECLFLRQVYRGAPYCILFVALLLGAGYYMVGMKASRNYLLALAISLIIACASILEAVILNTGGSYSQYYIGFILVIILVYGMIPYNIFASTLVGFTCCMIYAIPLLIFDKAIYPGSFIMHTTVIVLAFAVVFVWRWLGLKSLRHEIDLQFDMIKEKDKLQKVMKTQESSLDWYRTMLDNARDGIMILNRNGVILDLNERQCEMYDVQKDKILRKHVSQLDHSDAAVCDLKIAQCLQGRPVVFETHLTEKDSKPRYGEIALHPVTIDGQIYVHVTTRDISEKKVLSEHMLQSAKMDSIALLVSGVAHDFKNTLTVILSQSDMIRMFSEMKPEVESHLNTLEEAARKANSTVSNLLSFARRGPVQVRPLDLNGIITKTHKMIERAIPQSVKVKFWLDEKLPILEGDLGQMEQVFINLIMNAKDAMPGGGEIVISTQFGIVHQGQDGIPSYIESGKYIQITVSDTGCGITPEVMSRVFEPFFTTKGSTKGSGLGLSLVYGVVRAANGEIFIESKVGQGTAFNIFFPVSPENELILGSSVGSEADNITAADKECIECGTETILIVDDDQQVLYSLSDYLEPCGYKVISTYRSCDALEIYRRKKDEIDLVITDLIMPDMDGIELFDSIHTINPNAKILMITATRGYEDMNEKREVKISMLMKPFSPSELQHVIRQVFEGTYVSKEQDEKYTVFKKKEVVRQG